MNMINITKKGGKIKTITIKLFGKRHKYDFINKEYIITQIDKEYGIVYILKRKKARN